jgi:hypothetical protein
MLAVVVVVLAGAVTLVSVSDANAAADETAHQCAAALTSSTAAANSATTITTKAEKALDAVTSTALPGGEGWTSTNYAERPGAAAVKAVPAIEASEGVPAADVIPAQAARQSGAELISAVTGARAVLANIQSRMPVKCTTREGAARVASASQKSATASKALDKSVTALLGDFAAFQSAEHARVAAEVAAEASRVAAEAAAAEAARQAAAAEAARQAAAAEAARQAAAQKGHHGWCRVDNGHGGTYLARC